jgi:hypothetical protein
MRGPAARDVPISNRAARQRAPISERPADTSMDHRMLPQWDYSEEVDMKARFICFGGLRRDLDSALGLYL